MSKAVYVATMEHGSGKSLVTLGLIRMLLGKVAKVGYYKPIISDFDGREYDNHINTVRSYFNLPITCDDGYVLTKSEVLEMVSQGKINDVVDIIIEKFKELESQYDFLLVEGTDFTGEGTATELEVNSIIAKNLGIPAIIVEKGSDKSMDDFLNNMQAAFQKFENNDVRVLAIIGNIIEPKNIDWVKKSLNRKFDVRVLAYAIPKIEDLGNPTIKEVMKALDATLLFGKERALNNQVRQTVIGAMQLRNFLTRLHKDTLVVIPGDRSDLLLGVLQANTSNTFPSIAGVILTGGLRPKPIIETLIEGLSTSLPILLAEDDTYLTAQKISNIHPQIYAENRNKIALSIRSFEKYVDGEFLGNALIDFETKGISPRMFQYNLLKRAQKDVKHIVLPEGDDDRVLEAAARLVDQQVVKLTILGKEKDIRVRIKKIGLKLDLDKVNIIHPIDSPLLEDYVNTFYELRKHKKINLDIARDKMLDVSYFGTMMVYKGDADGMVSGAAHSTQHTILPALQFIKTKPGVSVVSSIFFMCLEDRVSVFGDCAINTNPTAEQLAEIAISSADSSIAFGIEPKIAMLSYSSGQSGVGEDVERVRTATEIVKRKRPDLLIEGPIQYDAAVDPYIAGKKMPDSKVAGQASVLIFPDLNTGNNTYKAVQRETGIVAIGPMLQGLNKPINDLSRGVTIDDIYNTVIITAIQAQGL